MSMAGTRIALILLLLACTPMALSQVTDPTQAPDPNAAAPQDAAAQPQPTPEGQPAPAPNLKWQKFPAEFADYYTTQRLLANPIEPQSFCKSDKPLRVEYHPTFGMNAVLDESGGTGTGYDTLYLDADGDGDYANDPVYKVSPQDRKTGLEGHALVSYFENVNIPRGADSVDSGGGAHVQMFVEHNPDRIEGSEYLLNMIPAQWAVGTVQINGQPTPVAMVDGTFNDSAVNRQGMRPYYLNSMAPGEDFGAVRSDYLIIGRPGEAALQPGEPNGWLGKTGSARAMHTQYLVTDNGLFEIQAEQTDQGVQLNLAPSNVPTSSVDICQYPHNGTRFAMFGTNTSVILDNPGSYVQVPADTYYVPAFGAYTFDAPVGGAAALTAPAGFDAMGPAGFDSLPDRDQMIFSQEPPGGELGTTDAVRWAQPRRNPFGFAGRPDWQPIRVQVLAIGSNEPIRGATLKVRSFSGGFSGGGQRSIASDATGQCLVHVSPEASYILASIEATGYVPTQMNWRSSPSEPLPSQLNWYMEKGTTVGGSVRNEDGEPIPGVQVVLYVQPKTWQQDMARPCLELLKIQTDRRGKWQCKSAPADMGRVTLYLSHPRYVSKQQSVSAEQLRDQTCEVVMKEGIALTGKVVNHKDKPVIDAVVNYGNYTAVKTNAQGRYRVPNLSPCRMVITVRAAGCAPQQKTVKIEEKMRPVDFELKPGQLLKGRVVDAAGQPVSAQVSLQSWNGTRNLNWSTRTDAQGRWTWTDAPADEAVFRVSAAGFMPLEDLRLAPDRDEWLITLRSDVIVTGRVIDAATGQPIPSFTATPGTEYGIPGFYRWQDKDKVTGSGGLFNLRIVQQARQYVVRIDAPGYLSGVSKGLRSAEGDRSLEIALKRDASAAK